MSILIRGMEMPKSCGECLEIGWQYVFECNLNDIEDDKRLITCPLVEIPPHGKLIDADRFDVFAYDSDAVKKYGDTFDGGVEYVLDVIAQSDTIIPADTEV